MRESMNLFGKALLAHSKGNRSKFFFENEEGKREIYNISRYFRSYKQLSKLEKRLISRAYGNILDIGCATGYYIPELMKKGKVLGIDISKNNISIARNKDLKNCKVGDIFKFKTEEKFDTIILMENNLGIGENVKGVINLIKIIKKILKKNGQILTIARKIEDKDFVIVRMFPVWQNQKGKGFYWISFNINFLKKICEKEKLKMEITEQNQRHALLKITKL